MLLVSFLLVIVATVFLVSGLFLTKDLALIFISIGCSALAGLVLVVAVLRSRPKSTPISLEDAGAPAVPAAEAAEEMTGGAPAAAMPAGAASSAGQTAAPSGKPPAGSFPIPNYESLEVVEVLPLLGDLTPAELEAVRQREAARRAHPWILARIDALLESEAETGEWGAADAGMDDEEEEDEYASVGDSGTDLDWEDEGSEWAPSRPAGGVSDWSASDFPLESAEEALFDDSGYESAPPGGSPIKNYDELRANEIMPLLAELSVAELQALRAEEAAGKNRTSIISRIDSLLTRAGAPAGPGKAAGPRKAPARATAASKGPSKAALNLPIEDYDSLTVAQITAQLANLSAVELRAVRTYERRHKARQGVLAKIEGALARAR